MPSNWRVLQLRGSAYWLWCGKFFLIWALLTFLYSHKYPWASVLQMTDILLKSWNMHVLKTYSPCWKILSTALPELAEPTAAGPTFLVSNLLHATSMCPILPSVSSLACQTPPKAAAPCQKWQGSGLALNCLSQSHGLLLARWSSACFSTDSPSKTTLQAAPSWMAMLARFMFLENSDCSAGTAHPRVWEP